MTNARSPHVAVALLPAVAIAFVWFCLLRGGYAGVVSALPMAALASLGAALVLRVLERARLGRRTPSARRLRLGVELAGIALTTCEVAIQATGGAQSPLAPLLYVFAGALFGLLPPRAALVIATLAALADALSLGVRGELVGPAAVRPAFVLLVGLVAYVLARWRGTRFVAGSPNKNANVDRSLETQNRSRKTPSRSTDRCAEDLDFCDQSAHHRISSVLELVHCGARPYTAALFWLGADGRSLSNRASITRSQGLSTCALRAGEGALGGILKRGAPVNLTNLRDPSRLTYYARLEPVRAFLGVPVVVGETIAGVLFVDRTDDHAFDTTDELLLGNAAREIARALDSERLLARVAEAKSAQERFFRASESFREALSFDDVYRAATNAAREVVPWDFAAVTRIEVCGGEESHRVACVMGDGDARFADQAIDDAMSLCAVAVKNRHELPLHGEAPSHDVAVFSPRARLRGYESLLVLPLVARGEAQGTLVLAARRPGAFTVDAREMLRIITNQAAGALEHADAYARLETLATTDGLTGLVNHRHFQERLADLCARSDRLDQKTCLILCDVDHFKRINDSYGHPVGDSVLHEVAAVLAASVRKIDVVARYGGEEFALVLEGTDAQGAVQLAERIRSDIATRVFRCSEGSFRVTMSFGVAEYPSDAGEKHALIDVADQALYAAKNGGRNRTVRAEPTHKIKRTSKAG